jgi:hypothetical protein
MSLLDLETIPWDSSSTQESWQALLDHFGYVAIELHLPVEVPYYFRREGWDCTLKITGISSYEELIAQRRFEGNGRPYFVDGGNFYRVVAE